MKTIRAMSWFILLALSVSAFAGGGLLSERFEQRFLVIPTPGGEKELTVFVAATLEQKVLGLQDIKSMPSDHGLLMILDKPQRATIWMKETVLPLDVVFIAPDGRILNIFKNAQPYSTKHMKSEGDVMAVFEVNAGLVDNWRLTPGQMLLPGLDSASSAFKGVAPEGGTAKSVIDLIQSLMEVRGAVDAAKRAPNQ